MRRQFKNPLEALHYHVTGAIERGEGTPIIGQPVCQRCYKREAVESSLFSDQLCGDCADEIYFASKPNR